LYMSSVIFMPSYSCSFVSFVVVGILKDRTTTNYSNGHEYINSRSISIIEYLPLFVVIRVIRG
jgi:hypothetical protein